MSPIESLKITAIVKLLFFVLCLVLLVIITLLLALATFNGFYNTKCKLTLTTFNRWDSSTSNLTLTAFSEFKLKSLNYAQPNVTLVTANNSVYPIESLEQSNVTFTTLLINKTNTDLIYLALDNHFATGRPKLYIGAQNYLHRVSLESSGLTGDNTFLIEESRQVSLRKTSECAVVSGVLPAEPTNNDLKVVFQIETIVLACGTDDCGRCYAYKQDDFSMTARLSRQDSVNSSLDTVDFIGSRKSVFIFFGEYNTGRTIYVASEPDGRPANLTTPFFSARMISNTHWNYTTTQSFYPDRYRYMSKLDLHEKYRQTYPIKFVYGFTHHQFAYILTVQPADIQKYNDSRTLQETRLSRICVNDYNFNSYIEISLFCSTVDNVYYVARTATISVQKQRVPSGTMDKDTLYVSFDGHPNSSVCAFAMKDVEKHFEDVTTNCYTYGNEAELIQAINGEHRYCESDYEPLDGNTLTCGSKHDNRNIRGLKSLKGNHVFTLMNDNVTSLGAVNFNFNRTHLIVGTEKSRLFKIELSNQNQFGAIKYFTQLNSSVGSFLPNPIYEPVNGSFYALTKRSLMQIPAN